MANLKSTGSNLFKLLAAMAEFHGREFSPQAVQLMINDLAGYPESQVMQALSLCRQELPRFPTLHEVIARIDDGRPGPEEAWALVPKSESDSVVWTAEMRDAFGEVRLLLEEDPIAARMSFREIYLRKLTEARRTREPVRWEPSLGHSQAGRDLVLRQALEKGWLSLEHVNSLLPEPLNDETIRRLVQQSTKAMPLPGASSR